MLDAVCSTPARSVARASASIRIAEATRDRLQLVVVGLPIAVGNSLYNCAVVIFRGSVRGIVPKQFIPNYKEFYEKRWFHPASGKEPSEIELMKAESAFKSLQDRKDFQELLRGGVPR